MSAAGLVYKPAKTRHYRTEHLAAQVVATDTRAKRRIGAVPLGSAKIATTLCAGIGLLGLTAYLW